jgi:hypothetical protein
MGNIEQALLIDRRDEKSPHKNDKRLSNAAKDLISAASPGGRFIFGTCSGLYTGMSPERVFGMYHLVDQFGRCWLFASLSFLPRLEMMAQVMYAISHLIRLHKICSLVTSCKSA